MIINTRKTVFQMKSVARATKFRERRLIQLISLAEITQISKDVNI